MAGIRDGWWLAAVVSPLVLLGSWMWWPNSRAPVPVWPSSPAGQNQETIATQWQQPAPPVSEVSASPQALTEPSAAGSGPEDATIDLDQLQHALANIGIDENRDLVLDEIALVSLRQAFKQLEGASPALLEQLQMYVQAGLAGGTGEQAARILGDYAGYRQALVQAEADWKSTADLSPEQQLEQTIALRRQHLGPITASQLFAGEEGHQRYLLGVQEVRANRDLSAEQRQEALEQLRADLRSGALLVGDQNSDNLQLLRASRQQWQDLDLDQPTRSYLEQQTLGLMAARDLATGSGGQDWRARYNRFERERESILRAGLAEEEKRQQINQLLGTHFTEAELSAAENWLPEHLRAEVGQ